jgi:hypothetical protein
LPKYASAREGFQLLRHNLMLPFGSSMRRIAEREQTADLTFWVYYGTIAHAREDMPLWMYKGICSIAPASLEFIGEYPARDSGVRVLAISMFGHPEEVSEQGMLSRMDRILQFNSFVGGSEIVLGGMLPNRLGALGITAPSPISFANEAGSVYGIVGAVEAEFIARGLVRGQDAIGIIGLGRIGGRVMRRLREFGHRLVALEKSREGTSERGRVVYTSESRYLLEQNTQIIIVITRTGDDIEEDAWAIPDGCVLFDETFPAISSRVVQNLEHKGCVVERVFLVGISASRAFGGYAVGEVPACLVQPMVRVAASKFAQAVQGQGESTQDWVDRIAANVLGLQPHYAQRP